MFKERHAYIPPQVKQAMDKHVQQNAVSHTTARTEHAMAKQLEKKLPAHMKQYAGTYVEQNFVPERSAMNISGKTTGQPTTYRPVTHLSRENHYVQYQASGQQIPQVSSAQSAPPTAGSGQPYDFIMNGAPKKRGPVFGNSKAARIAIVAGGILVLIIIAMVVMSFFSQGDKVQTERLIEVAKAQNEIIRVSSLGKEKARDINTRSFAANTRLSVESSQTEVIAALNKRGIKTKSLTKTLAATKNAKTDAALDEASQNNRFDDTFTLVLQKQLSDYQKLLQSAYDSGTPTEKKTLKASFDSAGKLVAKPAATAP